MIFSGNKRSHKSTNDNFYRYGCFVVSFLLICAAIYCRLRLLDVPLERDEGGFAYIGQQLLHGVTPYHSGNMKVFPGIHFAYAGIMFLFGENRTGIHTGLLVINLISILFMYLLARRILSFEAAVIASGTYAILSVSESVLGVFAHATHFVILFTLAGLISLLRGVEKNSMRFIFISGICLGIAILMKQHGVFFCLFAICYLAGHSLQHNKPLKTLLHRLASIVTGFFIPYAAVCIYMYVNGIFGEFWFWTVTRSINYALEDLSSVAVSNLIDYLQYISLSAILWGIFSLIGIALAFYPGNRFSRKWFIASLILFSVLAVLPGFYFYPHYFVLLLPALSLLTGITFDLLPNIFRPVLGKHNALVTTTLLFLFVTFFTFYTHSEYFFTLSPYYVSRTAYGLNPFPESLEIAKYIKSHTAPGTPIAVFGSEPQIYFYANRPSATDYLYMYPLVENQKHAGKMQREMIREIQTAAPQYAVLVWIPTSWMFDGNTGAEFIEWVERYLGLNYRQVGVTELKRLAGSKFYWDSEAENRRPSTECFMLVFKRMSAS